MHQLTWAVAASKHTVTLAFQQEALRWLERSLAEQQLVEAECAALGWAVRAFAPGPWVARLRLPARGWRQRRCNLRVEGPVACVQCSVEVFNNYFSVEDNDDTVTVHCLACAKARGAAATVLRHKTAKQLQGIVGAFRRRAAAGR